MTFISKPVNRGGIWTIEIREDIHPFSKVIEKIPCSNVNDAWKTYRYCMKEIGKTFGGDDFGARIPQNWSDKK